MGFLFIVWGFAVLVPVLYWAAASGRLAPHSLIGIRTQTTQYSRATWQAAHKAGLKIVTPLSGVSVVVSLFFLLKTSSSDAIEIVAVTMLIVYGVGIVVSGFVAQKVANIVIGLQQEKH